MGKIKKCFQERVLRRRAHRHASSDAASASPSPNVSNDTETSQLASTTQPRAAPDSTQTTEISLPKSISSLWDDAYKELDDELVAKYEEVLKKEGTLELKDPAQDMGSRAQQMKSIIDSQVQLLEEGEWKVKFNDHEMKVKDLVEPVVSILTWAKDYVSNAIVASPPASVAWAGVCLLLPLLLNPTSQQAARVEALERIAETLNRCRLREALYQRRYEGSTHEDDVKAARLYYESLKGLYVKILIFLATCADALFRNTFVRTSRDMLKWEEWKSLMDAVDTRESDLRGIEILLRDLEFGKQLKRSEEYHAAAVMGNTAIQIELQKIAKLVGTAKNSAALSWLATSFDPSEKYNEARKRHGPVSSTGDWLIKHTAFQTWVQKPNSLLWLHGQAGGGKTILSATVIHYLKQQYETALADGSAALAYYFFEYQKKETQSTDIMLRSLVANICRRRECVPDEVEQWYAKQEQSPSMEDLEKALRTAMLGFSHVFIVVDALDEFQAHEEREERKERKEVLQVLRRLNENGPRNLHLFLTSRPETQIQHCLVPLCRQPGNNNIDLYHHRDQVDADIATFMDKAFQDWPLDDWPPEDQLKAKTVVTKNAQGMFQYVALQIEALRNPSISSYEDRQEVLGNMPKGLDEAYNRILEQIGKKKIKIVHRALHFLAYAKIKPNVGELAELAVVDSSVAHTESNKGRLAGLRFSPPGGILSMLQGLVVVDEPLYTGEHYGFQNDKRTVALSHFTVKEYLESDRIRKSKPECAQFAITEISAKALIAESYLWYFVYLSEVLCAAPSSFADLYSKDNLPWFYTGHMGLQEADSLELKYWTPALNDLVIMVLNTRSKSFDRYHNWIQWYNPMDFSSFVRHTPGTPFPLLPFLTSFFTQLPIIFLKKGLCAVNQDRTPEPDEPALFYAAQYGKHDILKALLEAGADPYIVGSPITRLGLLARKCALAVAIAHKKNDCIETLLKESNALSRYAEIDYWPLREIAGLEVCHWEDKKKHFELLFALNPNIHCHEPPNRAVYTLPSAAVLDEPDAIDFLIDRGADIEGKDEILGTALQSAVGRGLGDNIARLIQHGAIVDPLSKDWAAFLDREVDLIAQGQYPSWYGKEIPSRVRHFQQIFGQLERYKASHPPPASEYIADIKRWHELVYR